MKTKANKLLKFPDPFTYKIPGIAQSKLADQVLEAIQHRASGDYSSQLKPSDSKNRYSISTLSILNNWKASTEKLSNIDSLRIFF